MNNNVANNNALPPRESFGELLTQLAKNSAAVVHDEIALVVQSARETIRAGRGGALALAAGLIVIFVAFMCLCAAAIIGLASVMAPVEAALTTGGALAFAGAVIALVGYWRAKKSAGKS